MNSSVVSSAIVWSFFLAAVGLPATAQTPWTFVSSPDLFNSDIGDLSGGTDAAVAAEFDASYAANLVQAANWNNVTHANSVTAKMAETYNELLAEMHTNAGGNPQAFLVAGDLLNGRWPNNATKLIDNFTLNGSGTRAQAIDNAGDVYYSWYRELFRQNGFNTVIGAIGDHDIGDNDWRMNANKKNDVDNMKIAFGRNMVDPLNLPLTWNGVDSTAPENGVSQYDEGSFIKQINNVLFVTVDVFKYNGNGPNLHPQYGVVTPTVDGTHLVWVDSVLTAADADPTVDHVILQGHTPVFRGTRKIASSGMMLDDRDDSAFWQTLQAHSHQNGGKVRMWYGGEVHATTAAKDPNSDIVQLVHGNPPLGSGDTNYVVFEVNGDVITANHYDVDLQGGGGNYWQVSQGLSGGVGGMTPGVLTGTMTIDVSGAQTTYQTSGVLDFIRPDGLLVHYGFDEKTNGNTDYSNTGSLGNILFEGNINSAPTEVPGIFGNALSLDGTDDSVRSSGQAPMIEGEQRTITAWINADVGASSDYRTIMGFGKDNGAFHRFNFQLDTGTSELRLNTAHGVNVKPSGGPALNDGQWHHVAVVLPDGHNNTLGDVLFYIDGVEYSGTTTNGAGTAIRTHGGVHTQVTVGATRQNWGYWLGELDDVALWGSPLSAAEIKAMYNVGNTPGLSLDALDMESLFALFDTGAGSTEIDGLLWQNYNSNITGSAGQVLALAGGHFAILLDDLGNGLITTLSIGDFDGNGIVDASDLSEWRTDYGQAGQADANGDGITDGRDFLIWQRNFGTDVNPLLSATVAIPEPAAAMLLVGLATFGLLGNRTGRAGIAYQEY
ncbi:MAG: hypothetical protein MI725_13760 [Pirellulales bacterium]|nr:hypothetical protein [Pirellulales bacterium]